MSLLPRYCLVICVCCSLAGCTFSPTNHTAIETEQPTGALIETLLSGTLTPYTGEETTVIIPQAPLIHPDLFQKIQRSLIRIGTTQYQYLAGQRIAMDDSSINRHGRGIAISSSQAITAGHLFDDNSAIYVAQLYDGTMALIQNVRKHENDLAAIALNTDLLFYDQLSFEQGTAEMAVFTMINGIPHEGKILSKQGSILASSLALLPGMSGSPLFTIDGNLIGINTAISNQGISESYAQQILTPFRSISPN